MSLSLTGSVATVWLPAADAAPVRVSLPGVVLVLAEPLPACAPLPCSNTAQEDRLSARPRSARCFFPFTNKLQIKCQKSTVFMLNTAESMVIVIPPTAIPRNRINAGCSAETRLDIWFFT